MSGKKRETDLDGEIVIKKRGEDGYRTVSVRIKKEILAKVDDIASKSDRSRNDIVVSLIEYGVEHVRIES